MKRGMQNPSYSLLGSSHSHGLASLSDLIGKAYASEFPSPACLDPLDNGIIQLCGWIALHQGGMETRTGSRSVHLLIYLSYSHVKRHPQTLWPGPENFMNLPKTSSSKFELVWYQFSAVQFLRHHSVWEVLSVQSGATEPSASV